MNLRDTILGIDLQGWEASMKSNLLLESIFEKSEYGTMQSGAGLSFQMVMNAKRSKHSEETQ